MTKYAITGADPGGHTRRAPP